MSFILILIVFGTQSAKITVPLENGGGEEFLLSAKTILKPNLKPPYHIYLGEHRKGYRATKLTPAGTCFLQQILVGVASLQDNSIKECTLFVWTDKGGKPDSLLVRLPVSGKILEIKTDQAGYIRWNSYDIPDCYKIREPFWVGIQESDTSFPTLVLDRGSPSLPSLIKKSATGEWADTSFDWFLGALVNYDTIPAAAIGVEPSHLVIEVEANKGLKKNNIPAYYRKAKVGERILLPKEQ